jgi:hypothetical protein
MWRILSQPERRDQAAEETKTAKNPTQQGGYVETKQPTYPREGRCVGRCVEDTGSLDWRYLLL